MYAIIYFHLQHTNEAAFDITLLVRKSDRRKTVLHVGDHMG